jgi:hypothetical protein
MLKGGVTYCVVPKITFNDFLTLGNTYTTLNDTLSQRIPQYYENYNGIHYCSDNEGSKLLHILCSYYFLTRVVQHIHNIEWYIKSNNTSLLPGIQWHTLM